MAERVWLASYPPEVPRSLDPYPEKSLFALLAESAARFPDRPAIVFPVAPMAKRLTYARLLAEVDQLSRALASLGVRKGDRVGLLLPNCPQYVVGFYAAQKLGAVVVGNNPMYTQRELSHQLKDAAIEVLIALDLLYPQVAAMREDVGIKTVVVTRVSDYLGFPINKLAAIKQRREARREGGPWPPVPPGADVLWWSRLMRGSFPPVPTAEVDAKEDVAALVYTGGTTGPSKGAMLTHFSLVSNVLQCAAWFSRAQDGREAVMCILPFFHSYGLTVEMNFGIRKAAKLVLVPRFELKMVLKAISKEKPSLFPGIPRIYIAINESPESRKYELSSIEACLSGAAALPVVVAEKFESLTGGRLVEGYGLTEASPVTHANPIYGTRKFGSIGLPFPDTDCKLVDLVDPHKELSPGEKGELAIAGPQVMKGYWSRSQETADMIREDENGVRWLYTGDIARMDEEGFFSIVDRKKEMVKVSGFMVFPTEVEAVLYRHPKVQKVCVVGLPDQVTGERLKAYVVLKSGQTATAEEIIEWCRKDLTGYRVPKDIEFRESLPETLVGKVLRRVLIEEEKQRLAAATG